MGCNLGELKLVDVRSQWPNEAADFTPWLSRPESLARLGAAVGLELELEHSEVAVGPFAADIVARDSADGRYVIIENQLGRTNHDHLGKLLTYSAAFDAGAAIWIASEFTAEHRKALDWLNDNSSEDVAFYGVQLELWSINDSAPAVRFNLVSQPRDVVVRVARGLGEGELSEIRRLQLEWWTAVRDALVGGHVVPSVQTPGARYWYTVAMGRSGLHISNIASIYDKRIGVRVYLRAKHGGAAALEQLLLARAEIEREIGEALVWDANPDARDKLIALYRDADLTRRDRWPEYIAWMVERIGKFRKTFGPRIKALDLGESEEEAEAEG